jgi:hypothetical protein
MNIVAMVLLD